MAWNISGIDAAQIFQAVAAAFCSPKRAATERRDYSKTLVTTAG
jgi:hypothetical protein